MFSKTLRKIRLEQQLTQSDMAKSLNISRVAYTNYELGKREPDFDTVRAIAQILDTSIDYLLDNSSIRKPENGEKPSEERSHTPDLPTNLRALLRSAIGLRSESYEDLKKYIDLLKVRDAAANRESQRNLLDDYPPRGKNNHHNHSDSGN